MVAPTPRGDRRLLQGPQPRRRLAGVEDAGAGAGDRLDEAGGQRRDAGEVAEEVERGALGDQQRRAPGRWPPAPRPGRRRATAPRRPACRRARPRTGASSPRPASSPKTTPGCFLHDPGPGPCARPAPSPPSVTSPSPTSSASARATISLQRLTGSQASRQPRSTRAVHLPSPACRMHSASREISRSTQPQRLIQEVTELPPFQTLIDEHAGDVMAVLRGAVGRDDADDCFQETFLAALRAYPKLGDASNLRGWLMTIAHRKAIDHHRARGRRPVPVAEVAEVSVSDPEPGDGIWAVGRRPAAETAGRGDPALRQRPPPRRDRRRARLLARGGTAQPARGTETTEKGAGMKDSLTRLAERASAEGLLDVAYTTTDSPFGPLLLATTPRGLVRVGPAEPGRRRAPGRPGEAGLPARRSRPPPSSTRPGASSTSTSAGSSTASTCRSTGS